MRMHAVVEHADDQEQRGRYDAVAQHLNQRALDPLGGRGEDADGDEAHMRHRGIGDQLLHVLLRERHQRGVDDGHDAEGVDERREEDRSLGEHGQREAQEAVGAELQQHGGKHDRTRGRRLDMGVGQPRVQRPHGQLDREGGEERQPQPGLNLRGEGVAHDGRDVGGAGLEIDEQDRQQHQHRTGQGEEEELEGRVDPPGPAPHPDDDEHRDQHALEEHVEGHEIEGAEGADQERLEHQEGDHVLLDPGPDRRPAGQHADRDEQGGQQHEQHGDTVDAHVIADVELGHPRRLLLELEGGRRGVEIDPDEERQGEGDERGPERDAAGVLGHHFRLAPDHHDEGRARQRQERDEAQDGPTFHRLTRPERRDTR